MKAEKKGINISKINKTLSQPKNKIEKGIQELLRHFLIDYKVEGVDYFYFAIGKISE